MTASFDPIGHIETCFRERFGTPRQPHLVPSAWGILHLRPELNLSDALGGLDGFSHLWLIFHFHQNTNKNIKTKVHPPRLGGEKIGLFATRTPHRPNPIGLSAVKLDHIDRRESGRLYLSGVDLIDGTPILDIKPYLPSADCIPSATAGWTGSKPERTIKVVFTPEVELQIKDRWRDLAARSRSAIEEILSLDPRPVFYKGTAEIPNPYTDVYGFFFDDQNVVYRMTGSTAEVLRIEPAESHERSRS